VKGAELVYSLVKVVTTWHCSQHCQQQCWSRQNSRNVSSLVCASVQ